MSEKRHRLTYANVMSSIAVLLCLSGTAVAAVTIDGSSIDNRSIAGKKLIRNTVTGKEIAEGTLHRVPNADRLDGFNSTSFVKGENVRVIRSWKRVPATVDPTFVQLVAIPGLGTIQATCVSGGDQLTVTFTSTTAGTTRYVRSFAYEDDGAHTANTYGAALSKGTTGNLAVLTNVGSSSGFVIQGSIWNENGTHSATYFVNGLTEVPFSGSTACEISTTVTFT